VSFLQEKNPLNTVIQGWHFRCSQAISIKNTHVTGPRWQSWSPHTRFDPWMRNVRAQHEIIGGDHD
jgi:hypothetical protein